MQTQFEYKGRTANIVFGDNAGKKVWIIKGERLVVFSTKDHAINWFKQRIDAEEA